MTAARPRARSRLRLAALTGALLVGAAVCTVVAGRGTPPAGGAYATGAPARLAANFLHDWVGADGRVIRRDQGGDTVSEGQAYGMLLALAVDDRSTFARIWSWTRAHLQGPDGSLAWRWDRGQVVDRQPAADADLDIAVALLRAGALWGRSEFTAAGNRISATALHTDTMPADPGRLLAAGPWALDGAGPVDVDPDYIVAGTADLLADATGDRGWTQVAAGTATMQATVLGAHALPPDWISATRGAPATQVTPIGQPGTTARAGYGLSAPRLLVRLAASCRRADRRMAADAGAALTHATAPALRTLDGTATVAWRHPITAVGAAAALTARGDRAGARRALDFAGAVSRDSTTYYGAAWVALGSVLLQTRALGSCAGDAA